MIASNPKQRGANYPVSLLPPQTKRALRLRLGVRKAIPAGLSQPLSLYQSSSGLGASTIGRSPAKEMLQFTSKRGALAPILAFVMR